VLNLSDIIFLRTAPHKQDLLTTAPRSPTGGRWYATPCHFRSKADEIWSVV